MEFTLFNDNKLTEKRRLKRKSVYLMHLMLVSMAPGVRRH